LSATEYVITHMDVDELLALKPVYQRPLREADIKDYAANWDIKLCDPIRVAKYPDGHCEIVDGQHRCHGFKRRFGSGQIHAFVATVPSKAAAAEWFVKSNTKRRLLSGGDLWTGRREAEEPAALLIEALCKHYSLELSNGAARTKPGVLSCRGALLEIAEKWGEGRLKQVLRVVAECWRNYAFLTKTHWVLALANAYEALAKDPGFNEEAVVEKLKATGPELILAQYEKLAGREASGRAPSVPKARDAILAIVG